MKTANVKPFEQRQEELCEEMKGHLFGPDREVVLKVEENTKCRMAYCQLQHIRTMQKSGLNAEQIIDALIQESESHVMPPKAVGQVNV